MVFTIGTSIASVATAWIGKLRFDLCSFTFILFSFGEFIIDFALNSVDSNYGKLFWSSLKYYIID